MLNIHRLFILIQFELIRIFKTKNGLIALSAFCAVWFILLYYMVSSATEIIFSDGFKIVASTLFGSLGLNALLEWPVAEFAIYWLVAVYSFPLFALFVTSDQTCSDKARGTLRFHYFTRNTERNINRTIFGTIPDYSGIDILNLSCLYCFSCSTR